MSFETFTAEASTPAEMDRVMSTLRSYTREFLNGEHRLSIEVYDSKSREQEKLTHSCYRDLAAQCKLAGHMVTADDWKRSLLQAFYEATKHDPALERDWKNRAPRMIPALDGNGFVWVGIESKKFTRKLYSHLITFVHSVGDERGVRWSRTSLGRDVPEEYFA